MKVKVISVLKGIAVLGAEAGLVIGLVNTANTLGHKAQKYGYSSTKEYLGAVANAGLKASEQYKSE